MEPQNKHQDIVSRARQHYQAALAEAEKSAEHTATEGWQHLYLAFHEGQNETRRDLAKELREHADMMEKFGLGEEQEKKLADIKKASTQLRDEYDVFERRTVEPVRAPVETCRDIISDARRQAAKDEDEAPMMNVGMAETMKMEIATWRRVTWDGETGRVVVADPVKETVES